MNLREIRRHCERVADALHLPAPIDVSRLVDHLTELRGRAVHLMRCNLPPGGPCGVCIATDTVDYVVVTDTAVGPQRIHIWLHELAHLLLEHNLQILAGIDATRRLLPHLDPAVVRRAYSRTTYNSLQEREAETLASVLGSRAGLWLPLTPTPDSGGDQVVDRLSQSLEHGSSRG